MITLLHIDTGLKFRGGQRQVSLLLKHLSKYDIKQFVATPQKSPLVEICNKSNIDHFPISESNLMRFLSKSALKKFIKNRDVDIIHAHDSHGHMMMVSLGLGKSKPIFVVTRRSLNPISFGSRTKYLKNDINYTAISENVKKTLINDGVNENNVVQIPDMIEADRYFPYRYKDDKNANGDNKFKIITAGAFDPSKGLITLIRAVENLSQKRQDFVCYLYGNGATLDELKKYVQSNNLEKFAIFPGWVDDTCQYWKDADIYVSTSHREGLNSSLLEAMACGICPIVTDISAHRENVVDGKTGFVFPVDDYELLADKINLLMNQSELRRSISDSILEKIKQYDADVVAEQIYNHYRHLIAPTE